MARKKKDQFANLPEEFVAEIDGSTPEQIDAKIVEITKYEIENQLAKADDGDLQEKKDAVKFASEGYRESTKAYKLKMKYIMQVLESKGKV